MINDKITCIELFFDLEQTLIDSFSTWNINYDFVYNFHIKFLDEFSHRIDHCNIFSFAILNGEEKETAENNLKALEPLIFKSQKFKEPFFSNIHTVRTFMESFKERRTLILRDPADFAVHFNKETTFIDFNRRRKNALLILFDDMVDNLSIYFHETNTQLELVNANQIRNIQ